MFSIERLCKAFWNTVAGLVVVIVALGPLPAAAQGATVSAAQADLTGNGVVNVSDAWQVVDSWNRLQDQGLCVTPDRVRTDVDGSGCVDVADVQKVLAHLNEGTSAAVAPQGAGLAAAGITYQVNTKADGSDTSPGDGVCRISGGGCSLKAAVQETNAHPGRDTITFDIRNPDGTCPTAPVVLSPNVLSTTLLKLDDRDDAGTVINGYSQCGSSPNTLQVGGNAQIMVELKGSYKPFVHGLVLNSSNNEVRGLSVYNWDVNILVTDQAQNNVIAGNFIGTNAANTFKKSFEGGVDRGNGIDIRFYATNTLVGGTDPASRNIVSGVGGDGVASQETAIGSKIWNNYVGLKQDGVTQLANHSDGMDFDWGSAHNYIGGTEPGQRNVISGNEGDGIELSHFRTGKISEDNHVLGNYIGLSATGGAVLDATTGQPLPVGNGGTGVTLEDHQQTVEIGFNYLSNNGHDGARIYFHGVGCTIHDNVIGLSPNGTRFPNGSKAIPEKNDNPDGIWLVGDAQYTVIARNVITANKGNGIFISNRNEGFKPGQYNGKDATNWNTITQNKIYGNDGLTTVTNKQNLSGDSGIRFESHNGHSPNQDIKPPIITDASTKAATGSACPNCTVEFFIADQTTLTGPEKSGEGKTYIGSGVADATGVFLIGFAQTVNKNVLITGTSTDGAGNTSVFAKNVAIGDSVLVPPTPEPTSTLPPTETPTVTATAPADATPPDATPTNTSVPDDATAIPGGTPGVDPANGAYKSWIPIIMK